MLMLEIKLDENKIAEEKRYTAERIYKALDKACVDCRFIQTKDPDGTLWIKGTGNRDDYGAFGGIITSLKERDWFMPYVVSWVWYNSDDGRDEEDFAVEDVLYHYTRRHSASW